MVPTVHPVSTVMMGYPTIHLEGNDGLVVQGAYAFWIEQKSP